MEGGVEKILSFSYLVYVIIGLAIGPAIEKLVEYVDIVLSYQETLNSLKAKVKDLTTIIPLLQKQYPSDDIERQGSSAESAESAVEKWVVKLRHLHRDAKYSENIARINVFSRYRASKEMKQKISEMEKHLKLFPLIQLELILRVLILTRRVRRRIPAAVLPRVLPGAAEKLPTEVIKRAAKSILRRMKMVIYFNREVASLKDLVNSITPIVDEIPRFYGSHFPKEGAINRWCEKMCGLVKKAGKIKSLPWWNVIRRYKDTKDVENLISTIEAHVKSASLISLEPLFQVKMDLESSTLQLGQSVNSLEPLLQERVDLESSSQESSSLEPRFQEMVDLESSSQEEKLRPSPQVVETFIEVDASNDEGLRAPQEVEASTGEGLVMKWKPLHISN